MVSGSLECAGYEVGTVMVHATVQFILHNIVYWIGLDEKGALSITFLLISLSTVKQDVDVIYSQSLNTSILPMGARFGANVTLLALVSALVHSNCELRHNLGTADTSMSCAWDASALKAFGGSFILHIYSVAIMRIIVTGTETLYLIFSSVWDAAFKTS